MIPSTWTNTFSILSTASCVGQTKSPCLAWQLCWKALSHLPQKLERPAVFLHFIFWMFWKVFFEFETDNVNIPISNNFYNQNTSASVYCIFLFFLLGNSEILSSILFHLSFWSCNFCLLWTHDPVGRCRFLELSSDLAERIPEAGRIFKQLQQNVWRF